jgi:hypothetical protein
LPAGTSWFSRWSAPAVDHVDRTALLNLFQDVSLPLLRIVHLLFE